MTVLRKEEVSNWKSHLALLLGSKNGQEGVRPLTMHPRPQSGTLNPRCRVCLMRRLIIEIVEVAILMFYGVSKFGGEQFW